jgi:LacI family transcriptional regulator
MPADIAMICFDDHDIFRLFPKGITAIQQPINEIAKKAIHSLIRQLEGRPGKQIYEQVELLPRLIKRGST